MGEGGLLVGDLGEMDLLGVVDDVGGGLREGVGIKTERGVDEEVGLTSGESSSIEGRLGVEGVNS